VTAPDWAALVEPTEVVLPVDSPLGRDRPAVNVVDAVAAVTVRVPAAPTALLLTRVPAAVGAGIEDVLLAALARALTEWCGRPTICIDVEGHGREQIAPDVDVGRTVGWFTAIAPTRLSVADSADLATAAGRIAAQKRARPGPALAFGALRYLSSAAATRRLLGDVAQRQLCFNYLGQFGHANDDGDSPIRGAGEDPGPMRDGRGRRRYLVEIDVVASAGELLFTWSYCRHAHHRATIAGLADAVVADLVALADGVETGQVGSAAFPASPLPPDEVAALLAQLSGDADRCEP
jgi:microcystin synthetase protein McyA